MGLTHGLLLCGNGKVASWGTGSAGQLGLRGNTYAPKPTVIPGLQRIIGIAAGGQCSAALDDTRQVWVWGQQPPGTTSSSISNSNGNNDGNSDISTTGTPDPGIPHCMYSEAVRDRHPHNLNANSDVNSPPDLAVAPAMLEPIRALSSPTHTGVGSQFSTISADGQDSYHEPHLHAHKGRSVNLKNFHHAPFFQNGLQAKSGFEMCFDIGSCTLGAGAKTRLESRIKKFTPHCVYRSVLPDFNTLPRPYGGSALAVSLIRLSGTCL